MAVVECGNRSLPRSLDVDVLVSRPQVEQTVDLSIAVFVTPDAPFDHGAGRIRYYSSIEQVESDGFATTSQAHRAASDFFAVTPRARRMAIGRLFNAPVAGFMRTKAIGALGNWTAVSDGSFAITIDGMAGDVTALDFSSAADLDAVAAVVQAGIRAVPSGNSGFTGATVTLSGSQFTITSGSTGASSSVSAASTVDPASGTDVSGVNFLNAQDDPDDDTDNVLIINGYTPGTATDEFVLIAEAARCSGSPVYGWALDRQYRDTQTQRDLSEWVESRRGVAGLMSNNPFAYDANTTTDIGSVAMAAGRTKTFVQFHDNARYYVEMANFAGMLSVDYNQFNSTRTEKFKDFPNIPTVGIDASQLTILNSKRYNTFTLVGVQSRTNRNGVMSHPSWFQDDRVNLDNMQEQIQVNVFNLFLRTSKVGYDVPGQAQVEDSIRDAMDLYVFNGTLSERPVIDRTTKSGTRTEPAYTVVSTPIQLIPVNDREGRVGPSVVVTANLRGAIHSTRINVNAFA